MLAITLPPPFCQIGIVRDGGPGVGGGPKLGYTLGLCRISGVGRTLFFLTERGAVCGWLWWARVGRVTGAGWGILRLWAESGRGWGLPAGG